MLAEIEYIYLFGVIQSQLTNQTLHTMQDINYIKTGGQFGRKRILPTFILEEFVNDNGRKRIRVTDERNLESGTVGVCDTVTEAVKLFKIYADARTKLF